MWQAIFAAAVVARTSTALEWRKPKPHGSEASANVRAQLAQALSARSQAAQAISLNGVHPAVSRALLGVNRGVETGDDVNKKVKNMHDKANKARKGWKSGAPQPQQQPPMPRPEGADGDEWDDDDYYEPSDDEWEDDYYDEDTYRCMQYMAKDTCVQAGCMFMEFGCGLFEMCGSNHGMPCELNKKFIEEGPTIHCDDSFTGCPRHTTKAACLGASEDTPCFWIDFDFDTGTESYCVMPIDQDWEDGVCPQQLAPNDGPPVPATCFDAVDAAGVSYPAAPEEDDDDDWDMEDRCLASCDACTSTPGCMEITMEMQDCDNGPSMDDQFLEDGMTVCTPQDEFSSCALTAQSVTWYDDTFNECIGLYEDIADDAPPPCALPSTTMTCGPEGAKKGCAQFTNKDECVAKKFPLEAYYRQENDKMEGDAFGGDGGPRGPGGPVPKGDVMHCMWIVTSTHSNDHLDGDIGDFCQSFIEDNCEDALQNEFLPIDATCYDDSGSSTVVLAPTDTVDICEHFFDDEASYDPDEGDDYCWGCSCHQDQNACLMDKCMWMDAYDQQGRDTLADLDDHERPVQCLEIEEGLTCHTTKQIYERVSDPSYNGPDKIPTCRADEPDGHDCIPQGVDIVLTCPDPMYEGLTYCQEATTKQACRSRGECLFMEMNGAMQGVTTCMDSYGATCEQAFSEDLGPWPLTCTDASGAEYEFLGRPEGGGRGVDLGPREERSSDEYDDYFDDSPCGVLTAELYEEVYNLTDGFQAADADFAAVIREQVPPFRSSCLDMPGCGFLMRGDCDNAQHPDDCQEVVCVAADYPCDVWTKMQKVDVETTSDDLYDYDDDDDDDMMDLPLTAQCDIDPEKYFGCAKHTTDRDLCLTSPDRCIWATLDQMDGTWICLEGRSCEDTAGQFVDPDGIGFECVDNKDGPVLGNPKVQPGQGLREKEEKQAAAVTLQFEHALDTVLDTQDAVRGFVADLHQAISTQFNIPFQAIGIPSVVVDGATVRWGENGSAAQRRLLQNGSSVVAKVVVSYFDGNRPEDTAATIVATVFSTLSGILGTVQNVTQLGTGAFAGVNRALDAVPEGAFCTNAQLRACMAADLPVCQGDQKPGIGEDGCCGTCRRRAMPCTAKRCGTGVLTANCIPDCGPGDVPSTQENGCPSCWNTESGGRGAQCTADKLQACDTSQLEECGPSMQPLRGDDCCPMCRVTSCTQAKKDACKETVKAPNFPVCSLDEFAASFDEEACCVTCRPEPAQTPPDNGSFKCTAEQNKACFDAAPVCAAREFPIHDPSVSCCPTCIPSWMLCTHKERVECASTSPDCAPGETPVTPSGECCPHCIPVPDCGGGCKEDEVCVFEKRNSALESVCRASGKATFKMCGTTDEQKKSILTRTPEEMTFSVQSVLEAWCEISANNAKCEDVDITTMTVTMREPSDFTEDLPCLEVTVVFGEVTGSGAQRRLLQSDSVASVVQEALTDEEVSEFPTETTTETTEYALEELAERLAAAPGVRVVWATIVSLMTAVFVFNG